MLTEVTIRFNYQEAMNRAKELEAIAGDLDKTQRNLGDALQPVAANWKGESATKYLVKGETLREQITSSSQELRNIASEVRRIAQIIYNAEMQNLEIAQRRDY